MVANIGLPSSLWDPAQRQEAREFWGDVIDIPYPEIPADATEQDVSAIANDLVRQVISLDDVDAVIVKGEPSLMIAVVDRLRAAGYAVYVAASERIVRKKRTHHRFVRFRKV